MARLLTGKTGILLINLGTPNAATPAEVRKFLAKFLHDYRVIEISRWIWCPILHFIILPLRPRSVAKKYLSVWMPEGSPLLVISQQQVDLLQKNLAADYAESIQVELAMSYSKPFIAESLEKLRQAGISRIIALPLYPQNSATTTGSCFDAISAALSQQRFVPELTFINGYAEFPPYIGALVDSIRQYWQTHGRSEKLLISFHGLPKRNVTLGDPYLDQCKRTALLLTQALQLNDLEWQMVFQSRFGKAEWLQPYCSTVLKKLADEGIKTIDIVCPGFTADCLETLEEISQSYAEEFIQAGGKSLNYIPALNASDAHIEMLASLLKTFL